jgi:23S rRNA (uridine2552-2'-O)-methyltransferase
MSRSKSSRRWLKEHHSDDFVIKSRQQNWRSRAVYKLAEIDQRDRLIKPDSCVIELGAAPGGWTQYAAEKIGAAGVLVAVDILPMDPVEGAVIIQADFTENEAVGEIERCLNGRQADLVLSDMAPNFTGQLAVDQPRSIYLAELALDMCSEFMSPGGSLLVKTFHGTGFETLNQAMRERFDSVRSRKPAASRARSREVYLLAQGWRSGNSDRRR